MHSPQGVLGLFPDWFGPRQTDWPLRVTLTGFPLFDEAEFRSLDPELEDFLAKGPAPVVFTPGSTLIEGISYYAGAAAALNTLGCRGIFLARQDTPLPRYAPNILTRYYVPLSVLLPSRHLLTTNLIMLHALCVQAAAYRWAHSGALKRCSTRSGSFCRTNAFSGIVPPFASGLPPAIPLA
jgi:hypothetical protein